MKTLRFLCFASLFALIICLGRGVYIGFADEADSVGVHNAAEENLCKGAQSFFANFLFKEGRVAPHLLITADQGGTAADIEASNPPTPVDLAGNVTPENRHSSGTITITMTGMVGDPGDIGG